MKWSEKVLLIIMDGWGHSPKPEVSAIEQANTPFIDQLYKQFPVSELITHSEDVGLPVGQMGNSEVGHMNIGAGRVVDQELLRINNAIRDKELEKNEVLLRSFFYAKENQKKVHFMGLVSHGGIHSHSNHLKALCDIAKQQEVPNVFIHAFTDGRDSDPKSGLQYIKELEAHLSNSAGRIASVMGRYYAMDRDNRWERIKIGYDCLVSGIGDSTENIGAQMERSYGEGVTDEFIKPIIQMDDNGAPLAVISEGDVVICFNFRTDRCREITKVLTQEDRVDDGMTRIPLHYLTMTNYDETFEGLHIIFENKNVEMTLGETLEHHTKTQLRISETEKYAHVTYFFSGGREQTFNGEDRVLIPSPKVATYDMQPEMSAFEVKDKILPILNNGGTDFICLNFANTDMVGHTGIFEAAVKAAETVDKCVEQVVTTAMSNGYASLITSDHGNADFMVNDNGTPNTAHTKNPVPLILVKEGLKVGLKDGKLADLAPTILALMDMDIPGQMTGEILI